MFCKITDTFGNVCYLEYHKNGNITLTSENGISNALSNIMEKPALFSLHLRNNFNVEKDNFISLVKRYTRHDKVEQVKFL